ncbi:SRPBCC family protein [Kocuria massiliensis]|uniref:SRPBCC family protein n=1 Tax=Kocuria massiliensis TaxID=1926282 RepID=UPI00156DFF85|nr:SRPBCC family protein [Kocuria massiliensis]
MMSRHISQTSSADPDAVYRFAADPRNLPRWASGLAQSEVKVIEGTLEVESPMGTVTVTFAPHNEYGVLDHDVALPSGDVVTNPLRVMSHPDGSEILFTVRQLDLTDEEFDRDCATVREDVELLVKLVENQS